MKIDPSRGSCWPFCGLRSLGMFMPLLKLQKEYRSSFAERSWHQKIQQLSPVCPGQTRQEFVSTSNQPKYPAFTESEVEMSTPVPCSYFSCCLVRLLVSYVIHSNPYNRRSDISILIHSTSHKSHSHIQPRPMLELSLLKYNLSQFIDFETSFFKDIA